MVGMAIALDFDEEILEVMDVEPVYSDRWWYFDFLFDNVNENPGNDRIEEGALRAFTVPYPPPGVFPGGDIPQFTRPVADQDHEIFHIHFRVKDETPVGTVTVLSFPDFILIERTLGLRKVESWNVVTLHGGLAGGIGVTPIYEVKPLVVPGQLQIVGELILFLRGDASGDGVVDMTDAVNCLEYLFLGSYELHCPDAADANDDGELDLTDPISILVAKFLGTIQIPPPNIAPGLDPTEDSLDCSAGQETSPES